MAENNPTGIPQEWITVKTLKTISGASLCCWLTTVFFDLICFMPIRNLQLHALLVLIVSTVSCLGLAIYKVSNSRGKKTRVLWMLVIPNAMLIYIHALGFQVASKELALRANANEIRKEELRPNKAGVTFFFSFLAKQTSWIPSLELTNKTIEFEKQQVILQKNKKLLMDSISKVKSIHIDTTSIIPHSINNSDSSFNYIRQYKGCIVSNTVLKNKIDSLNNQMNQIANRYKFYDKRDSILTKKIEEKNALINKWNQRMNAGDMRLQKTDMERIIDGHMGDENYYKKLFKPIIDEKKSNVITGY
jgi:hypothetical protein